MVLSSSLTVLYLSLFFGCYNSELSLWNLLLENLEKNLAFGVLPKVSLKSADFYVDSLKFKANFQSILRSRNSLQFDGNIISGNGIIFKQSENPVYLDVILPQNKSNVCGLIIGSGQSNFDTFIKKVKLFWRKTSKSWNKIADPTFGEFIFNLDFQTNSEHKVILIDPIPADEFRIIILSVGLNSANIQLSVIHECQFLQTIKIDNCIEKLENNPRFEQFAAGEPISISCPTNCEHPLKCVGYNVYTKDSPICLAAYQRYGNCGDGNYFLYIISRVSSFESELNPELNNGVFCRRSNNPGPGITFNRHLYDKANKENDKQT